MSAAQIAGLPRTALALRSEGGRGNDAFVDGATEVRVRSARDLVRVLIHGQLRRAVHATGLNAGSSRSHAVFQARLVKLRRDAAVVPLGAVPRAAQASVRTMTLVDLAGSERARRTHAQGERLAEAGKINVGLMTLKKCLDVRRFNAADAQAPQLVPYNESKVTRLFQPALEGGAKTVMVVCVDPYEHADADARAETRAVLDFARVASSLVARVRRVPDPPPVLEAVDGSDVAADSEDEIFFDVDASRKRASAAHEIAHDGAGKRQRRGLGGEWQRLDGQANEPDQANEPNETNEPDQTTSEPNLIIEPDQTTSQPGQSEWLHIARGAQFSFEVAAPRTAPRLGAGLDAAAQREAQRLRAQLAAAQAQAQAQARELDEVASYAEALERAVAALRAQSVAAQARAVRVEEETRREAAAFFVAKIAQVQAQAGARLDAELEVSAAKAAHKLDILARLRALRGESDDSDLEPSTAEVATVSPRTALRRAVSRAASKKANKMGSVSAGEAHELASLRAHIDSLDAQASSQATQLEMVAQARAADRARAEALEAALLDANGRAAALEARLMRHAPAHAAAAELAVTRAHEQERAELLAQITLLKQQLRDADTHSLRARRQWETHELLPVQERLRVAVHEARRVQRDGRDMHVSEALERAERARDDAWAWWTREQERSSQLCAQNDVLMREIRHLRAQLLQLEPPSPRVSVHSEPLSDSDDSFCRVSLHSASALSAVNGGNPLGAVLNANASQASVAAKPLAALDRVISKGGRVLHRNPTARSFAAARDSSDAPSLASPPAREGRAKRVVSRVFQLPGRRHDASAAPHRPYLAGRFANTDSAVGSYSAEVFSFERGGDAAESQSSEQLLAPPPKLRSIVYSGPIVSHKTGGVSVTFTSQEVSDLPLRADPLPELSDEDGQAQGPASVAELPGDVDMAHDTNMPDDVDMASDAETPDKCAMPTGAETPNHRESAPALSEFPSMASLQSTVKKKRKLHAARTVIDIGSPENALDDRMVGAPTPADLRPSLGLPKSAARVSSAALPQENTQPVLFTPVRTRSRGRAATESSAPDSDDPKDSIFTTPMKMLSRLRNRKK
ncbi:Kinesin-like protein kif23 [Coemansia sp. Cherry 401B]|nr:Kinesin-like protein kif23 [Coemansia sp. Cherry 401B]